MASGRGQFWEQAGFDRATARQAARDESTVLHGFWTKLARVFARLPFIEDLLTAYYCAFDRDTPLQARAALLGALAYFVLPFDFLPDMLPVLGFTDDAAVLAAAIKLVMNHIRPEHRRAAQDMLDRLRAA